jgi:hypothetical protein
MLCPCGHYRTSVVWLGLHVCLVSVDLMRVVCGPSDYFLPCLCVVHFLFPFCLLFLTTLSAFCPLFVRLLFALCPAWVCLVLDFSIFVQRASKTSPSVCFKNKVDHIKHLSLFVNLIFEIINCYKIFIETIVPNIFCLHSVLQIDFKIGKKVSEI